MELRWSRKERLLWCAKPLILGLNAVINPYCNNNFEKFILLSNKKSLFFTKHKMVTLAAHETAPSL